MENEIEKTITREELEYRKKFIENNYFFIEKIYKNLEVKDPNIYQAELSNTFVRCCENYILSQPILKPFFYSENYELKRRIEIINNVLADISKLKTSFSLFKKEELADIRDDTTTDKIIKEKIKKLLREQIKIIYDKFNCVIWDEEFDKDILNCTKKSNGFIYLTKEQQSLELEMAREINDEVKYEVMCKLNNIYSRDLTAKKLNKINMLKYSEVIKSSVLENINLIVNATDNSNYDEFIFAFINSFNKHVELENKKIQR